MIILFSTSRNWYNIYYLFIYSLKITLTNIQTKKLIKKILKLKRSYLLERLTFFKSVADLDFSMIEGFTISESNDFITDLTSE